MTTRALVAYASKHGSTAGIAEWIGDALRNEGFEVDVWPARHCSSIGAYDVVVLGSGVYMNRWHSEARDFAKRFERELAAKPTWFFSSGPIGGTPDATAKMADILQRQPPAPGETGRLAERIGVRGHATFAGRIGDDMTGIFERWIPRGDWRDQAAIRAWSESIVAATGPDGAMADAR